MLLKTARGWAVVVWEAAQKRLWLAKDPFGSRHLHYVYTDKVFCWSTRHECLSRMIEAGHLPSVALTVDAQYRAASAVAIPPIDATPYNEVRSIPPAHYGMVRSGAPIEVHRYAQCVESFIGQKGRHIPVREISDTEEQRMPTKAELEAFDQVATSQLEHSDSFASTNNSTPAIKLASSEARNTTTGTASASKRINLRKTSISSFSALFMLVSHTSITRPTRKTPS